MQWYKHIKTHCGNQDIEYQRRVEILHTMLDVVLISALQGLYIFHTSCTCKKCCDHFSTHHFFVAGVQTNSRQSGNLMFSDHHDLKVRQDVDWHDDTPLSPGSCVADQPGDSRLQGLSWSTVETSSVRHRVGPALVFHIKSMALHPCRLPDSPV